MVSSYLVRHSEVDLILEFEITGLTLLVINSVNIFRSNRVFWFKL